MENTEVKNENTEVKLDNEKVKIEVSTEVEKTKKFIAEKKDLIEKVKGDDYKKQP
jgi:hypothetical protein